MSKTKYISKKIFETENSIKELDEEYDASERIGRLIHEDDRRKLVGERDTLVKKRDRGALYMVLAIVFIVSAIVFGLKTSTFGTISMVNFN